MSRPKIASYWASACGGCDVALLDVHERLLDLAERVEIVFWPIALDTKYADVEALPDGAIDITLLNGAIQTSDHEAMAHLLRRKSKTLVACGSCAHIGGIPGLANLFNREQIFQTVYRDVPSVERSNGHGVVPLTRTETAVGELELPELHNTVRTLSQVVEVDYSLPGCPPPEERVWQALQAALDGALPPRGAVLGATDQTQCEDCPREKRELRVSSFRRIATEQPEPERCLLEQGFLCLGPATRGGCGALCQRSGVGCRGCFGPPPGVLDQGAKALGAVASVLECDNEARAAELVGQIPDPVRSFARFSIPSSLLRRRSLP